MVQSRAGIPGTVGLVVRMPENLRDRIKAAADANGRSQNSEIVATLEEKYPAPKPTGRDLLRFIHAALSRRGIEPDDPKLDDAVNEAIAEWIEAVGLARPPTLEDQ